MLLCCVVFFFFFFQAEDGIRDAQESRGLGDVYKRQESCKSGFRISRTEEIERTKDFFTGLKSLESKLNDFYVFNPFPVLCLSLIHI